MIDATLVAIHGFGSSPATWNRLNAIWSADKELRGLLTDPFGYPSPRVPRRRPFSTRRIPDYDDIAQSFANRYEVHYRDAAAIAIVTHSQGGLILQRFLAWMVREGRGRELARIRTIVMLPCPNSGSEYLSSLRRALGYDYSPQARSLETLDKQVADAQRTVLQRVVYATGMDDLQCRIPFHVYAGDSDGIVPAASAQAAFPRAGVLPGDHFSILDPGAPGNATAETVKHYLLADLATGQASPSRGQATSSLPLVGQVTDRAVLGIHPAIPLPPSADPALSPDLPLYILRDIDASLRAWATAHCDTGGFLLLTGPAAVGKTRSAYQLIRDNFPDWPLLMPATAEQLTIHLQTTPTTAKLIVWLNEVQDYLGPGGLTAASIRHLLSAPQPVIIIGTIWPARYDALTAQPPASRPTNSPDSLLSADPNREAREILTILADRKDLPSGLSPAEQRRAASIARLDPRIAEALADADARLTQTLAAAPDLISRWISAANPYGAAIITAATTARRCGHPQPLPPEVLQPLAQDALTPALLAQADADWFTPAVEWARQPVRGQAAPLTPQAIIPAVIRGDNVSDILVQHAAWDPAAPWHRVPETAWRRLIDNATPHACVSIADAAYSKRHSHHTPVTQHALEKAADAGNLDAMFMLALMLYDREDPGPAERWYRKAADGGHSGAMYYLGFLLADQGDIEHAERWYRKAADAGNFGAMSNLAVLLREQGHSEEAEQWDHKAAEAGQIISPPAQEARPLPDPKYTEQLHRKADAGDADAMFNLGVLSAEHGDPEQTERWFRKAANAGDPRAMNNLGNLLSAQGHAREAEQWYQKAIATDGFHVAGAMYNLGNLHEGQGRLDLAEQWYRRAAALGHTFAMLSLGRLFARQDHADQAEQWYRKAAAAGISNTISKLAEHEPGDQVSDRTANQPTSPNDVP